MIKNLFLMVIVVLVGLVFSQSYTQTSAETKIEGRTVKKSVLRVDCPHVGDSAYTDTGGVDLTTEYHPQEYMRALVLTEGTGNIGLVLAGGGQMVVEVTVDTTYSAMEAFTDWQIKKILADSITTFTGRIFPLW